MRIVLILVALLLGSFAAIVFEAANASATINNRAGHARLSETPAVRDALLTQAETIVRNDAFNRTLWHAGAAESASWVELLRGDASPPGKQRDRLLRLSRDFAQKAVRAGPITAPTWLRLALLDEAGIPNTLCRKEICLTYAYEAAPIARREMACARADAAIRAGMIKRPDDPRITQLGLSGTRSKHLPQCLPSASSQFLFSAMLRARRDEERLTN